jgi:hypothetical protein
MKASLALVSVLAVISGQAQQVTSYRTKTVDALLAIHIQSTLSQATAWVENRSTNYMGGGGTFIYDGASTLATNNGTIFKPSFSQGRWIRSDQGNLQTDFFGRTTTLLNEALAFAENARIEFPRHTDLLITSSLKPKSYSTLIGNGSRLVNGATNLSGLILMDIDRTIGTEVYGLRFDHPLGCHWNTGSLTVKGSTNISIHHNEFKHAGYLTSILVQDADNGAHSEAPRLNNNMIYDQLYGSSSQSAANLSIAESTRDAIASQNRFIYNELGTLNLGWVPLGQGNPNYPSLVASFDRAFGGRFIDNEIVNPSRATNLIGFALEDNSGTTNVTTRLSGNTIEGVHTGIKGIQLRGSLIINDNEIYDCTGPGIEISQSEAANEHGLRFTTIHDNILRNNNNTPLMGQDASTRWRNDGGQIRFMATPPFGGVIEHNQFLSWSQATNFMHVLYGGGNLIFSRNQVVQLGNTNAFGLYAADPYILNESQANLLYKASAANRDAFVASQNQFTGIQPQNAIFNVYEPAGDNSYDQLGSKVIMGRFSKRFPLSTASRLFSIKTIEANQTTIGNSGGWSAFIFVHLSNQPDGLYTLGNVGTHGRMYLLSHAVNELSTPATANSTITAVATGAQAKTGTRGLINVVVTAVDTSYHTTEIRLSADGEADTAEVAASGMVMLIACDMYAQPQFIP